ncbi:MAG: NAD(P)/FAD-dependent oxidoreductase [Thermoplasmata archaeon]
MVDGEYDVVVVGLGPAGVCASVQLTREGFSVSGVEAESIGGALNDASNIENLPVCGGLIPAQEIINAMDESIKFHGVRVVKDRIIKIERKKEVFVAIGEQSVLKGRCVIIASGLVPKKFPGLEDGKNVFYRARDVGVVSSLAIIGGGDAAFDAVQRFSGTAEKLYLIARGKTKAIAPLLKRARENPKVQIIEGAKIREIVAEDVVQIQLQNWERIIVDKTLICIGKERDMRFLPRALREKFEGKKLIPRELCKGMYAAGDFLNPETRYISCAIGSGLDAALLAAKFLRGE